MKIVLDTNILVTALKSRRGASFKLISMIPDKRFSIVISVALILEYEAVLRRGKLPKSITLSDINDLVDYLCFVGIRQEIFYLWRPFLPDPSDDHILELAVAAQCDAIVTYNKKDFRGVEKRFGIRMLDSKEFLQKIGVLS
ncbi:MAG: putative toxin-antitoxin system toxin component, PIN family [Desulfobacteraceae bacterium]|nr:putative toxin-antitoxin system toxin component, PIN family [Desulfobacteraceae bacterium]